MVDLYINKHRYNIATMRIFNFDIKEVINATIEWVLNIPNIAMGLMGTIFGYFLPVKDVVHIMVSLFILDAIFGFLAAKKGKVRKGAHSKKFSVSIIWETTIPRMLISVILIMAFFLWDTMGQQDVVNTYKWVGWFISGVLIFSIAENGFIITKWSTFLRLRDMIKGKVNESTNEDISVEVDVESEHKHLLNKDKNKDENDTNTVH